MSDRDKIEIYDDKGLIAVVESSIIPRVGEYINVRGVTWKVGAVSYCVDNADDLSERRMRCNIDVICPR